NYNVPSALVFAETLDEATDKFLDNKKSPSRKVNELDNRGSHFYLATYWAEALASQNKDLNLKERFSKIASELVNNETTIINELNAAQGAPVNIGGYYKFDETLTEKAMKPSETLNTIISEIS
ncbi:Isocitrate dehydrogenase [NADP]; Monomeric isocitrate dehydrogenase [NADP], partial [hydrothermal vent metagenome]